MELNNEMILVGPDQKEVKCTVVATFDINDKKYIAYTDGTVTDDGEELFVSRYEIVDGEFKLQEITDEYEWKKVDDYLDEYLYDEEDI